MDYTLSNGYVLDAATGKRMHVENQAVPTSVSDRDLNSVAWSLMAIVEAAGMTGIQFSKDNPASYRRLLEALNAIYAKLDSPAFKGSPTVPTLPVGDNSLGIVNTAHLAGRLAAAVQPYESNSSSIAMAGAASVGVKNTVARGDHRHPTDTTRAPLSSPAFTGKPTAPTAAPGTNTKEIANAEFVQAIFASIVTVAPGTTFFTSGSSAPARSLKANGAAVSRTAYAALFEAIGTMYGSGDGSTTFNLPDLRGEFLRCLDDGRGVDAWRTLNSFQGDAIRNIAGKIGNLALDSNTSSGAFYADGTVSSQWHGPSYIPRTSMFMDASRVVPTANENRPRNIALLACIAY